MIPRSRVNYVSGEFSESVSPVQSKQPSKRRLKAKGAASEINQGVSNQNLFRSKSQSSLKKVASVRNYASSNAALLKSSNSPKKKAASSKPAPSKASRPSPKSRSPAKRPASSKAAPSRAGKPPARSRSPLKKHVPSKVASSKANRPSSKSRSPLKMRISAKNGLPKKRSRSPPKRRCPSPKKKAAPAQKQPAPKAALPAPGSASPPRKKRKLMSTKNRVIQNRKQSSPKRMVSPKRKLPPKKRFSPKRKLPLVSQPPPPKMGSPKRRPLSPSMKSLALQQKDASQNQTLSHVGVPLSAFSRNPVKSSSSIPPPFLGKGSVTSSVTTSSNAPAKSPTQVNVVPSVKERPFPPESPKGRLLPDPTHERLLPTPERPLPSFLNIRVSDLRFQTSCDVSSPKTARDESICAAASSSAAPACRPAGPETTEIERGAAEIGRKDGGAETGTQAHPKWQPKYPSLEEVKARYRQSVAPEEEFSQGDLKLKHLPESKTLMVLPRLSELEAHRLRQTAVNTRESNGRRFPVPIPLSRLIPKGSRSPLRERVSPPRNPRDEHRSPRDEQRFDPQSSSVQPSTGRPADGQPSSAVQQLFAEEGADTDADRAVSGLSGDAEEQVGGDRGVPVESRLDPSTANTVPSSGDIYKRLLNGDKCRIVFLTRKGEQKTYKVWRAPHYRTVPTVDLGNPDRIQMQVLEDSKWITVFYDNLVALKFAGEPFITVFPGHEQFATRWCNIRMIGPGRGVDANVGSNQNPAGLGGDIGDGSD